MYYTYKEKNYTIFSETKIKIDGVWVDGIIYLTMYYNPDGRFFVRTKEEFFKLFKENSEV